MIQLSSNLTLLGRAGFRSRHFGLLKAGMINTFVGWRNFYPFSQAKQGVLSSCRPNMRFALSPTVCQ